METFVLTIFWVEVVQTILRIFNMATDTYPQQTRIGVYAADTAIGAAVAIWAGFALWYS